MTTTDAILEAAVTTHHHVHEAVNALRRNEPRLWWAFDSITDALLAAPPGMAAGMARGTSLTEATVTRPVLVRRVMGGMAPTERRALILALITEEFGKT